MPCDPYPTCVYRNASQFAATFAPFAQWASYEMKWPLALILAQWTIESGWGANNICTGCYNPANTSTPNTTKCSSGATKYSNLCDGVRVGFIQWTRNNRAMSDPSKPTYEQYVKDAYSNGFTIPATNNYGCVPGAGTTYSPGLKAACAALGSSGWAASDYCYCNNNASYGKNCCGVTGAYAGQQLYSVATQYFSGYDYVATTRGDCCTLPA